MLSFIRVANVRVRTRQHWIGWDDGGGGRRYYPIQVQIRRETTLLHTGHWDRAAAVAAQNLAEAEQSGLDRDIANCRYNLAGFRARFGDFESALLLYGLARDHYARTGNRVSEHLAIWNIGSIHWEQGDGGQAMGCYRRSLAVFLEAGLHREAAILMGEMGKILAARGERRQAEEQYARAIRLSRERGNLRSLADALNNAAGTALDGGDHQAALAMFQEALELNRKMGDLRGQAFDFGMIGEIALKTGSTDQALASFERVLAIRLEINDAPGAEQARGQIGRIRAALGPRASIKPTARQRCNRRS